MIWAIGFGLGRLIGILATKLRNANGDVAPNDFLALALIALSYSLVQWLGASGFLAAFAAGLGLRRAELGIFRRHQPDDLSEDERVLPSEALVNPNKRLAITAW